MCRKRYLTGVLGIIVTEMSLAWGQGGWIRIPPVEPVRSDYFSVAWTSVGVLSEYDNNEVAMNPITGQTHRTLIIKGMIQIEDTTYLLGLSIDHEKIQMSDQNEQGVPLVPPTMLGSNRSYRPCLPNADGTAQEPFMLTCPLNKLIVFTSR